MAIRETDTLAVVVYKAAFPIQIGVRMTANGDNPDAWRLEKPFCACRA